MHIITLRKGKRATHLGRPTRAPAHAAGGELPDKLHEGLGDDWAKVLATDLWFTWFPFRVD